ncbi:hypothetical protein ACF052_05550 [Streptomyces pilosus]|uniref:hypothetical protein n=1 Tax=Streptomyces pilosus TaxID=28893 RepID=UPI0035959CDE
MSQWVEREGMDRPAPRGHCGQLAVDGEAVTAVVKLSLRPHFPSGSPAAGWVELVR